MQVHYRNFADPKKVPLCLAGTVSKTCWRFYTDALRRRLTRSHCIVGALSMAICQWDSKSIVWAAGVSSLLWWKVLEERPETLVRWHRAGFRRYWRWKSLEVDDLEPAR